MSTQTVFFNNPATITALQTNVGTAQTNITALQSQVSSTGINARAIVITNTGATDGIRFGDNSRMQSAQPAALVGSSNLYTPVGYDPVVSRSINPWDLIAVYSNLRNCITGPLSNIRQRAFAEDDPTNIDSALSSIGGTIPYKYVTMSSYGITGLTNQFMCLGKYVMHLLYNSYYSFNRIACSLTYPNDEARTRAEHKQVIVAMKQFSEEIINSTIGTAPLLNQRYVFVLNQMIKSTEQAIENKYVYYNGSYETYMPTPNKTLLLSTLLRGNEIVPFPNAMGTQISSFSGSGPNQWTVEESRMMPNVWREFITRWRTQLQIVKNFKRLMPELGAPPVMWGSKAANNFMYPYDMTDIFARKAGVPNGDGMGQTFPVGFGGSGKTNFNGTAFAGCIESFKFTNRDWDKAVRLHPFQASQTIDQTVVFRQLLNNGLSQAEKDTIFNECKYLVEQEWLPLADEIVLEQENTILTNGKKYYDNDLWCAKWRSLVPGTILNLTNTGSVGGFYNRCRVDMTGVSANTIRLFTNSGAYTETGTTIVNIPLSHPFIKDFTDGFNRQLSIINCLFPGDNYIATYQVDTNKTYNNYASYFDILSNYSVNVITVTGAEDVGDAIYNNGNSSAQLVKDIKYKLANEWIGYVYSITGANSSFSGATGLDSFAASETNLDVKYNDLITLQNVVPTLKNEILSDIEVLGYNYGFIPSGVTGAPNDLAPVFVLPGFTGPTFAQLYAQQTGPASMHVDAKLLIQDNLEFTIVYRQHYQIRRLTGGGILAGTPISSTGSALNLSNMRTDWVKDTNVYEAIRRRTVFTTTATYYAYKMDRFLATLGVALWNQAIIQQDFYSNEFIDRYLLATGPTGARQIKYLVPIVYEGSYEGGFNAAGSLQDPNNANKLYFTAVFGNTNPYGSASMNPSAGIQVFCHELYFGHGVQYVNDWLNIKEGVNQVPWPITALSNKYGSATSRIARGVNNGVNFEGFAVYGELLSFCLGYHYKWNKNNTLTPGIQGNYPGYILSNNSAARVPARQTCDVAVNNPKYGWSSIKLVNEFARLTGLDPAGSAGFIERFLGNEAQQTTYNAGFCVNVGARAILIGLLGSNFDERKYVNFRITQTAWFVSTGILDYVQANPEQFSKDGTATYIP